MVLPQYILCSSEAMANDLIHAWGTKDNIGNKEYYLPKYRKTESFALYDLPRSPIYVRRHWNNLNRLCSSVFIADFEQVFSKV